MKVTLLTLTKDGEKGRAALAQYIIRNTLSLEKLTYNREIGTDIYRSKMTSGKNKILHKFSTGFQIYTAEEFIAAITQHIPVKSFQMIRYYGWYSNKSRGLRKKQGNLTPDDQPIDETDEAIEIIDETMSWFMNSSMTCLRLTHMQMVAPIIMNPVLREIKPFLVLLYRT